MELLAIAESLFRQYTSPIWPDVRGIYQEKCAIYTPAQVLTRDPTAGNRQISYTLNIQSITTIVEKYKHMYTITYACTVYTYIWSTEMLKSVWRPNSNSCVCRVGQWLFRMVFRFIFRRRCRNFCFCKVGDENAFSAQFASFSFPTRTNFISAIVQIINIYPTKTLFMLVLFHTQMFPATTQPHLD